jgi:hypothetical protein
MKTINLILGALLLNSVAFSQPEYVTGLPDPPAVMKQEYVTKYFQSIDSIQSLANKKITLYKAENQAVVDKIDKTKIAQSYTSYGQPGSVNVNLVQEMQTAQQVALTDQKNLDALIAGFKNKKDSIDLVYKSDIADFTENYYKKWLNKCSGAVTESQETECDNLLGILNGVRQSLLEKYFFGSGGMYSNYIKSYIATVSPAYIEASKSMMAYSEMTLMGTAYPHKEDLAYVELADDLVIMIHDAYNIDGMIWPTK